MLRVTGLAGLGLLAGCASERTNPAAPTEQDTASRAPREGEVAAEPPPLTRDAPDEDPTEPDAGPAPEPEAEHAAPPLRVEVICRDALGLSATVDTGETHRLERVTLHHTAAELGANHHAPARLRGHQRYHLDQGWPDIAYHYAVDLRGNVYELRDPGQAGDTFTEYDPMGHLLVVCEGNYDIEQPSDAMLEGVAALLAAAATTHGVDPATLTGHRDHASGLTCPGDALQVRLPELRTAAAGKQAGGPTELITLCGDDANGRVARIEAGVPEENET